MLDLGVPISQRERGDDYPLLLPEARAAVNPLPYGPFIDCFVIGTGGLSIKEIIEAVKDGGERPLPVQEL